MTRRIKAVFFDIDGTLTTDRDTYDLSIDAIIAIRRLVESGIIVSFVSSNSLPVVVGLGRYIGINGFSIGETGCLIYSDKTGLIRLTDLSAKHIYHELINQYSEFITDSWQNPFRICEFALKLRKEHRDRAFEVLALLRKHVELRYPDFTVDYSGYAFHIRPRDVDKGRAVLEVLKRLGIDPSEAGGVGDSYMDSVFLKYLGLSAAVSNADEELKRSVTLVLSKPSGLGVAEFAELITGYS